MPRLDPQRLIEGHQRAFVDRRQQGPGRRIDALRLAQNHGVGTDEGHEARRVIRRAARHLVTLVIPGFHQIGGLGRQHPVLRALQQVFGGHDLINQPGRLGGFGV